MGAGNRKVCVARIRFRLFTMKRLFETELISYFHCQRRLVLPRLVEKVCSN